MGVAPGKLEKVRTFTGHVISILTPFLFLLAWLTHAYVIYFYEYMNREESRTRAPEPVSLEFQFSWTAPGGGYKVQMDVPAKNDSGKM